MGEPLSRARPCFLTRLHVTSKFLTLYSSAEKKSVYGQCSSSCSMKRNESLNSLCTTSFSDFHTMRNSSQGGQDFLGTQRPFTHFALSFSLSFTSGHSFQQEPFAYIFRPERPFHSLLSQQHAHRIDRFPTNFSSKAFERRFSTLNLRRLKALFRTTFYACGLRPLKLLSRNAAPKGLFTFTHFRSHLFFQYEHRLPRTREVHF